MAEADHGALPVAGSLPALDEDRARFANIVHALIVAAPGLDLRRGCHVRPGGVVALADPAGLLWQVPDADGAADLDSQIALLIANEAMLHAIEQALGLSFQPAESISDWPADTLWIAVHHDGADAVFGFAPAMQAGEGVQPPAADHHADLPRSIQLSFRAASLPLAAVEALDTGDLLCLPAGPLLVDLTGADAVPLGLQRRWSPADGSLFQGAHTEHAEGPFMDSSNAAGTTALAVPVTVRLPAVAVAATELATLAEGGTIRLMPLAEGLEVELLVAGRPIATGELVRLGDDFAVLVERIAGRAAMPAPAADA